MEILHQNQTLLEGTCKLSFEYSQVDTYFNLEYRPYSILLKIPYARMRNWLAFGYGKFEGNLQGTQIPISCSKIAMSSFSKKGISFAFPEEIIIGNEVKIKEFRTRLIGTYLGNVSFQFRNLIITITEHELTTQILDFCRTYGDTLEGSELRIFDANNNELIKNETIKLSKDVCLLLSFINATLVTYNRYQFISSDNQIQEIWGTRLVHHDRGHQCIDIFHLNEVLQILLPHFCALNTNEQKCLETVIGYLNSVAGQYLEDSILNIAQAWEILADTFNTEKIESSNDIQLLKKDIKSAIKNWKVQNSISYDTDFISNRLLGSLNWEIVIKKLEGLAIREKLDIKKLRINFKKLIEIRNSIVHTGRFRVLGEEEQIAEILYASVFGLQVLILFKLGYEGYVIIRNGGTISNARISDYIIK